MKREEHPLSEPLKAPAKVKTRLPNLLLTSPTGPLAKAVELMNARNYHTQAEANKQYEEFCSTLQKLHNEKTYVPPVCLT